MNTKNFQDLYLLSFSPKGRMGRKGFWKAIVLLFMLHVLVGVILGIYYRTGPGLNFGAFVPNVNFLKIPVSVGLNQFIFLTPFYFIIAYLTIVLYIRRVHDIGLHYATVIPKILLVLLFSPANFFLWLVYFLGKGEYYQTLIYYAGGIGTVGTIILFLIFALVKGTNGENKYGEKPDL